MPTTRETRHDFRAWAQTLDWITQKLLPGMQARLGVDPSSFDVEKVKAALMANWQEAGGIAANVMGYVSRSGLAMLAWLACRGVSAEMFQPIEMMMYNI